MRNHWPIHIHRPSSLLWAACALQLGLLGACGDDDTQLADGIAGSEPATDGGHAGEEHGGSSSSMAGTSLHSGGATSGAGGGGAGASVVDAAAGVGGVAGAEGESAAGGAGGAGGGAADCVAAVAEASIALSVGHVDVMSLGLDCHGELVISTRDDTAPLAPVLRRAEAVLIHGGPEAALEVPPDLPPEYAFLGPAGSIVWLLPEVQLEAVVWPGWDLAAVPAGVYDHDRLTLRLDSVTGPGRFVGYHADFVPNIVFDLERGLDEVQLSPGSHAHLEWFFSAPGLYELSFTIEASVGGGARKISRPSRHRFFLGDLQDLPPAQATVVAVHGLQPTYAVGDLLELTTSSHGAGTAADLAWLRQCVIDWDSRTLTAWQQVGTGVELAYTLTGADGGCQFRAAWFSATEELATSQSFLVNLH